MIAFPKISSRNKFRGVLYDYLMNNFSPNRRGNAPNMHSNLGEKWEQPLLLLRYYPNHIFYPRNVWKSPDIDFLKHLITLDYESRLVYAILSNVTDLQYLTHQVRVTMRDLYVSSLFKTLVCWLFGAKPLSESVIIIYNFIFKFVFL